MDNEKEINDLLNILEMGPTFKKVQALKRLIDLDGKKYIQLFRKYLSDKDWHLRSEAAFGLSKYLGKASVVELAPLLNDKAFGVREDVRKIIDKYCSYDIKIDIIEYYE